MKKTIMGAFLAKYFNESTEENRRDKVDTTKATPRRKLVVDPRSPTIEISRTPIQVEGTPRRCSEEAPHTEQAVTGASAVAVSHQRVSALQLRRERDPRSPSYGIARTPLQVPGGDAGGQPVERVQEILMYEGRAEVPLGKNSPRETANPSCARIMGLSRQGALAVDADMVGFLSGLSQALSLTDTQQQRVMSTYQGHENPVRAKTLPLSKETPSLRRMPLCDVNSPHQMWRGHGGKDRRVSPLSENTPPSRLHDTSRLHAVWDQDATVVI
ncbi:cell division cycle-associated protein 3-like isoform X1 [Bacillus rossius redtenbacheri]|uniref:cell division cycle-associated protein 3-like isoform X1 n=1 Tax=Bacillus rossius redtenbacheri TaxID=93214 RepID=UPI002FDD0E17